jgi:hypothetical protein
MHLCFVWHALYYWYAMLNISMNPTLRGVQNYSLTWPLQRRFVAQGVEYASHEPRTLSHEYLEEIFSRACAQALKRSFATSA